MWGGGGGLNSLISCWDELSISLLLLTHQTDHGCTCKKTDDYDCVAHSASTVATTPNLNLSSPTVFETSQTSRPQLEPDVTTG